MRILILLALFGATAAHAAPKKDVLTEAASDPAFKAKHPLKKQAGGTPKGEIVSLKGPSGGVETAAYLAVPKGKPRGGIVVFHEWWGLNDFVKLEADKLARLGFVAIAPDLYGGEVATDPETAKKLMTAVDETAARAIVTSAFARLESQDPKLPKIATLGWCFGGTWSMRAAIQGGKDVDAAVVYYGELPSDPEVLAPLKAPVLAHVPKRDAWITPEMGQNFSRAMQALKKPVQLELYEADHAFANPSNPNHHAAAARAAWAKTVKFLDKHIPRRGS